MPRAPRNPSLPASVGGVGATDVGYVRLANQDAILVAPDLGLYAVLDGVGGAPAGQVASRTAATVIGADGTASGRTLSHGPNAARPRRRCYDQTCRAPALRGSAETR